MVDENREPSEFAAKAMSIYAETLKHRLEPDHIGKLIALDPETGEYVLAPNFRALELAVRQQLDDRPTYMFAVGGGPAVRIGANRARVS